MIILGQSFEGNGLSQWFNLNTIMTDNPVSVANPLLHIR